MNETSVFGTNHFGFFTHFSVKRGITGVKGIQETAGVTDDTEVIQSTICKSYSETGRK
jgi:DeoR/GlpR family transcriptional regulator of sugar metabolism